MAKQKQIYHNKSQKLGRFNRRGKRHDAGNSSEKSYTFTKVDIDEVSKLATQLIESESMELVHIEYQHEPIGWVLRCYIDKEGGVTIEDCSYISRQLGDILDVKFGGLSDQSNTKTYDHDDTKNYDSDMLSYNDNLKSDDEIKPDDEMKSDDTKKDKNNSKPEVVSKPNYILEVSSPGSNRPLKKIKDFERFIGEKVHIKMKNDINGRKNFKGRIEGISEGMVYLITDETTKFSIPFEEIDKARLDN